MSEVVRSSDWPDSEPRAPKRRYELQYWSSVYQEWRTWSTHRTLAGAKFEYALVAASPLAARRIVDHGKDWRQSGEV